jgi:hypothetical protein
VGWTQVFGIIRAKLGSFGEKAQMILSSIFDLYNLKHEDAVLLRAFLQADPAARATRLARCTAAPRASAGRGDERPIGSSAASTARVRMAAAMASGTNPDPHVQRGDWFGHFFGHLFEMS